MTEKTNLLAALSLCAILPACAGSSDGVKPERQAIGMANPASVWCVKNRGGKLEIRRDKDGGQYGVCILPDGTEVEEWELFGRDHAAKSGKAS
jgi:putative hemolysin